MTGTFFQATSLSTGSSFWMDRWPWFWLCRCHWPEMRRWERHWSENWRSGCNCRAQTPSGVFTYTVHILARCHTSQHPNIGSILFLTYDKFMPYITKSLICVSLCKKTLRWNRNFKDPFASCIRSTFCRIYTTNYMHSFIRLGKGLTDAHNFFSKNCKVRRSLLFN
jgi:hypothetical protein